MSFGESTIAVPNARASANIVCKISIARDGREKVIEKDSCHCHVHLEHEKISQFSFVFIDVGFGDEPCCELKTSKDETFLKLYLRGSVDISKEKFAEFSYKDSEFVKGSW